MNQNNLKSKAIRRLVLDMIETVKQKDKDSTFFILVLDDFTTKILSFYLTMSDVLNLGIFAIEYLGKKRKTYPTYSVIYFLEPCKQSCELVNQDFTNPNDPHYGNVHIYFTSRVLDSQLSLLVSQNLAYKVKSLIELNIAFFAKNNIFDIRNQSLTIFETQSIEYNSERRVLLGQIKDKLMTVIVSMKEFPYIQYQDTKLCSELASLVNASLHELNDKKLLKPERKSICLIVDRSVDLVSPLLHDYSYRSLIYDFFDVDNEGILNLPSEDIKGYKLDENDVIWNKYKNSHIAEVLKSIQIDVEEFNSHDLAQKQNTNLENFDDMIKVVQGVKGYREMHKQLNLHLKLCNKILKVSL